MLKKIDHVSRDMENIEISKPDYGCGSSGRVIV
jgi:hypothetical protein